MKTGVAHVRKALAAALIAAGMFLHPVAASSAPVLTDQEKADLKAVVAKLPQGKPSPLNMADETTRRVFYAQLKRTGIDTSSAPGLMQSLKELETRHAAAAPGPVPLGDANTRAPAQSILNVSTNDNLYYSATALSSIPGGSVYSTVTLTLLDGDGAIIAESTRSAPNVTGTNVTNTVSGLAGKAGPATAYATFFSEDKAGHILTSQTVMTVYQYPLLITNVNPIDSQGDGQINVCLNRSNKNFATPSCDYCYYSGDSNCGQAPQANTVMFPISGSIVYSGTIDVAPGSNPAMPNNPTATVSVTDTARGGSCNFSTLPNIFTSQYVSLSSSTLSTTTYDTLNWNITPASFPQICYNSGDPLIYNFTVTLSIQGYSVVSQITNGAGVVPAYNTVVIPPIYVLSGCVAEGTLIQMAGGVQKKIEDIQFGDRVVSDNKGTILTVTNIAQGEESNPLYQITAHDHTVLLTGTHPVITKAGVVAASRIKAGETIETLGGNYQVTAVKKVTEKTKVYNLSIGVLEDRVSLEGNNRTYFAGGVRVGDWMMQNELEKRSVYDTDWVKGRLPAKYQPDYEHWLATQKM